MGHEVAPAIESRIQAARDGGDRAAALLRSAGCRPTPQRLLVLQALGAGAHVTAEEALTHARARVPTITASTVYRALEALVAAGLVRQSDLGAGRLHYELRRDHPHHQVVCETCGAVAHVHDAALEPLARAIADATGYRLSPDREVTIPAVCPDCQGAAGARDAAG